MNCQVIVSVNQFILLRQAQLVGKPSIVHNELWKILKEMGIPYYLTCLLRKLYVGQESTESEMKQQVPNWERSMSRLYIVTLLI